MPDDPTPTDPGSQPEPGPAQAAEPGLPAAGAAGTADRDTGEVGRGHTGDTDGRGGSNGHGAWAIAAALCVLLGAVASVLGARAVASNDKSGVRTTFQQSSNAIASSVKLAIQRQEELTVAASTYFAANPKATPAEFARWARWARTRRRYPELDALGLLPAPAPPAVARTAPAGPQAASASTLVAPTSGETSSTQASSTPAQASSTSAQASDTSVRPSPATVHASPAQLLSRDTGLSVYTRFSAGGRQLLAVETPVYRGNVTPHTVFGRTAASVGWLRTVLVPGAMLAQVRVGHPGYALGLIYRNGTSNLVFSSGAPVSGAQSSTLDLHDGWIVTSFGPAVDANVFADRDALAVLIGGILLSVLLGLLVDVIGAARSSLPAPAPADAGAQAGEATGELPDHYLYEPVTGLPNRELTLDRAERMVARAGRDSGMLAGALFVDIDQLREVNEKLGIAAGNQLLKIVGERLLDVVRAGDTVGRLDGDEFVVLVESAARGVRLDSLAQRMIEALHKPIELDDFGPSFVLTASIGVAFGRYATPEDLLRDAHVALVSAKTAGKDRYTLFNANMRTVIEGRAVLEAELSTALSERQFFLLYEPIYDLDTRKVASLQALIRWQHPTQGVLAPAAFVPLAEETGLIVPIGRFMLEEACARAAAWDVARSAGADPAVPAGAPGGHIGVSVKASAHQLSRDGFVTDVQRALQQSGIEPSLLTLEIPETALLRDLAAAADRLHEIKRLGVSIAIDDFGGSGYAHQADLQRLPLDSLRVDRRSLAASEDESYRSWLLEAIMLVGHELALTVVATGIETHEQLAALRTLGCTMAQGALLGAPAAADAVAGLFDVELPPGAAVAPVAVAASGAAGVPEAAGASGAAGAPEAAVAPGPTGAPGATDLPEAAVGPTVN
jgi:diguanylate cyclase (GGDEF)-like protein